jgi:hypothetical protein
MKVFLHTRRPGKFDWANESRNFGRLPVVGEFVALASDSPWYQVQIVVHCPFEAEYEAEVYAVEIDHTEAKQRAFNAEG